MEKKITKVMQFERILADYPLSDEHKEFIKHEIELLKRKSDRRTETSKQKADKALAMAVLDEMSVGKKYFVEDVRNFGCMTDLATAPSQKICPLVNILVGLGLATKGNEKGKVYWVREG